jgi:FtsP/CotA-like multicopper oxidase with cupredoxin domain
VLTNWLYHPYLEVRARRYRFRLLNGSVARLFTFALVRQVAGRGGELPGPPGSGISYDRVPFHMVANDGNLMEHAVPFDGSRDLDRDGERLDHKGQLPAIAVGERYDIVVDFARHGIAPGDRLYLVNLLAHDDGKGPKDTIPLAEVLSGEYRARLRDDDGDGLPDRWVDGDPAVGRFLELRVRPYAGVDLSMDPRDYEPGGRKMIPLKLDRDDPGVQARLAQARHRTFEFARSSGTDGKPWTIKTDGGQGLDMDARRISAAPQLATGPTKAGFSGEGTLEVWSLEGNGGWSHPVHVHFEEGIVLRRGGEPPPEWEKWARKDIYRLGPLEESTHSVEIAIQFREFAGTYVEHCHNTQHEDRAMMVRWDLEHPGQLELMPTPIPTWDGVEFVGSVALPTFRSGDGVGPSFDD